MISDLEDKDILSRVARYPNLLELMLSLDDDDLRLLGDVVVREALVFNLDRLRVLDLLMRCSPAMLRSYRSMLGWDRSLIERFFADPTHAKILHRIWDHDPNREGFVRSYLDITDHPCAAKLCVQDAFSSGQIDSKVWLLDTVSRLGLDLGLVWILCGWIGTLPRLLFARTDVQHGKVRSFDIDMNCTPLAELLNQSRLEDDWTFKATTLDVNTLSFQGFNYETLRHDGSACMLYEVPDTVINTSCDHMISDSWWESIPRGRLVILQNNDWDSNEQHTDAMQDLAQFKSRYPMSDYMFEGELDCTLYRRFMLIGRK